MELLERIAETAGIGVGIGLSTAVLRLFMENVTAFYTCPIAIGMTAVKAYHRDAPLSECVTDNLVAAVSSALTYSALAYFL